MLKREFYLKSIQNNAHYRRDWVLDAFTVTRHPEGMPKSPDPFMLVYTGDGQLGFVPDEGWVKIEDSVPNEPLYSPNEPLDLKAGDVENLFADVETSYGDLLFNARVLVYAFGSKVAYRVGIVSIKELEKEISTRMRNDPLPDEEEDPTAIYVRDYIKYGTCMDDLGTFCQLFVPAVTPKSLTTDPRIYALRAELLEKYKDRLHDPAIVAVIQNELIEMDKAWIKGDSSEAFYINSDKAFNTARKRMFLIHGPEAGFDEGGDAELVVNSLEEGWDMTKMPAMVNSLRAGSYYRGYMTALGGESVKFFLRIFQNVMISEKDCGSKLGVKFKIDKFTEEELVGMNQIKGDTTVELTDESLAALRGQVITIRHPMFCRTGFADFCETCMGAKNSENPGSLGSRATDVGSTFMSIMMASAHAKELKTAKIRFDEFLQ